MATAGGLVFIGATIDSRFRAFDSHSGKEVWTTSIPAPAVANPIIFRGKSGREYVVIAAGGPGTLAVPGPVSSYRGILIGYALPKPGEIPVDLSQYTPQTLPDRPAGFGNRPNATVAPPVPAGVTGGVTLPIGEGREDVVSMCSQCHDVSTAIAVRRSPEAWHDLIQDMRSRGAQGDDAKAARAQAYLSRYFGLMPTPADPVSGPK